MAWFALTWLVSFDESFLEGFIGGAIVLVALRVPGAVISLVIPGYSGASILFILELHIWFKIIIAERRDDNLNA